MATARFNEFISSMEEPMTYSEIESVCESLNIKENLKQLLEQAESNGDIVSKKLSHHSCHPAEGQSTTSCVVVYFKRNNNPEISKSISSSTPSYKHSYSRLNLPFRSPTVIRAAAASPTPASCCTPSKTRQVCITMNESFTSHNVNNSLSTPTLSCINVIDLSSHKNSSATSPARESSIIVNELELQLRKLTEDISLLSEAHNEEDLDLHIKALHEYNEIKDVGQLLLGKLAESMGLTTVDMYDRFSLNVDD